MYCLSDQNEHHTSKAHEHQSVCEVLVEALPTEEYTVKYVQAFYVNNELYI